MLGRHHSKECFLKADTRSKHCQGVDFRIGVGVGYSNLEHIILWVSESMLMACDCSHYQKLQLNISDLTLNTHHGCFWLPVSCLTLLQVTEISIKPVCARWNRTNVFSQLRFCIHIQSDFVLFCRCDNGRRAYSFSCRPLREAICVWSCGRLWLSGAVAGKPTWIQNAALTGNADALRHANLHHLHRSTLCFPQPAARGGRHRCGECIRRTRARV